MVERNRRQFAFDLSTSISAKLRNTIAQVIYGLSQNDSSNEYLALSFDKNVKVIDDWTRDHQRLNIALGEAVRARPIDGTALYDACDEALTRLASSKSTLRVIVVISDGQDNASKLTFKKLRQRLMEESVILYAIGLPGPRADVLAIEGQGVLDELTEVTGGFAFYPRENKDVMPVLSRMFSDWANQYVISFRPTSAVADNGWHPLKFKLKLPDKDENGKKYPRLNIRSRRGYYDR